MHKPGSSCVHSWLRGVDNLLRSTPSIQGPFERIVRGSVVCEAMFSAANNVQRVTQQGAKRNGPSAYAVDKNQEEEENAILREQHVPLHSTYQNMSKGQSETSSAEDDKQSDEADESTQVVTKKRTFVDKSRARIPSDAKNIINPKSKFQSNWDVLMMLLLVYTAIVTPFETGFLETDVATFLFALNRVVDICFLVDLVLQFYTPFYSNETGGWEIEHQKIARHYLTGWFSIDVVSILPFDTLGAVLQNEAFQQLKILRAIRLLRLAKLLRIFKGSRIIKRMQSRIGISYAMQTMIKFCVMILMVAHWLACMWGIVLGLEENMEDGVPKNWATEHRSDSIVGGVYSVGKQDPFLVYLAALYWAVMTVTTIGYGDIVPVTAGEQFLCVISMLLGASTYAYVIGTVCGVIALMDQATSKFNQQMDELNLYMEENQMPNEMRVRLREYFNYCKQMNRQKYYQVLMTDMSPTLRGEVASYINSSWLDKVAFFNPPDVTPEEARTFCVEISMKLLPEAFAPQELLIRVGEPTEKMYMIQRGVVAMKGRIISSGTLIGDDFVMHNAKRDYNVRGITYADVFTLTKRDREEIFDRTELPTIKPRVRKYAIQLAFRKAFVQSAKGSWRAPPTMPVKRASYMTLSEADEEMRLIQTPFGYPGTPFQSPVQYTTGYPMIAPGFDRPTKEADPEEDIIGEAEKEIAISQEVTSPKKSSPSKPSTSKSKPVKHSPPRINTSVSGSAAKVLQLMEDRHRQLSETTEKILRRQMKFDNDLDVRIKQLAANQEESEKKFLQLGYATLFTAFVTFVLCIVVLVK